ncbi:MAG: alkanesulfonate monooxygenase, partial [Saprospiraceae bacterium]
MDSKRSFSNKTMRFYWRLVQGGESENDLSSRELIDNNKFALPELEKQIHFCQTAEELGIDGLLVDINYAKPDPILLSTALAYYCKKLKFIVAVRSGLLSPTLLTQQVNTFSYLNNGRILLNVVAGHSPKEQKYYGDFLAHDERYDRTNEFMEICNSFWRRESPVNFSGKHFNITNGTLNTTFQDKHRKAPYIFIAGGSAVAGKLAVDQGDCWMQLADSPKAIDDSVKPVLKAGIDIGLRLCVIARASREEAISAAYKIIQNKEGSTQVEKKEKSFVHNTDSLSIKKTYELADSEWLTDTLWTGAIRHFGAPCIALVGSYEEVASAFIDYKKVGV